MTRWLLLLITVLVAVNSAAADEILTLEDCLQRVREHNPTLLEATSKPRLAATEESEAHSAYRPRVEFDAGYTLQNDPQQIVFNGITAPTQDQNYAHASFGINQLLYDFGRSAGRSGAAEAARRAAGHTRDATEQDLLLRTVAAYFRVLTAKELLLVARDEVAQTDAHLRTAQALHGQGMVTHNDVLQAEVELAANRQQVLSREGEEANAWLELNYLTGRPFEARGELAAETNLPPETKPDSDLSGKRPDLLAQSERVIEAREQLQQAKGGFWPELYGHLGADYVENSYVREQTIYSATLGVKFTLYDGAARDARLSRAEEKLRQQQQRLMDLQQRARLAEQTARNDARVAAQRIDMAHVTIRMAEENLRINQDRYREQVGTATEVLDAETLLTRARTDLARSKYDYQVAVARVRHATGRL